ncbi:MAG TPA: exodeoxyribonuclease VII small subunit [Steroidobacteraceae bacterium]|nr:exodeoxyribonuclease VII small subunit [Steroidobacteraceae bacterium]
MPAGQTSDEPEFDFERSLAELEAIVERLEQGELTLEESLRQFERGIELTRHCQSALGKAEQRVEILMRRAGSGDVEAIQPFEPDQDA